MPAKKDDGIEHPGLPDPEPAKTLSRLLPLDGMICMWKVNWVTDRLKITLSGSCGGYPQCPMPFQ